nr:hypothetical protein MDV002.3 [synthetic construct]ACF49649.1 hypothetical protein MDV078.6 [synthetic construct]
MALTPCTGICGTGDDPGASHCAQPKPQGHVFVHAHALHGPHACPRLLRSVPRQRTAPAGTGLRAAHRHTSRPGLGAWAPGTAADGPR